MRDGKQTIVDKQQPREDKRWRKEGEREGRKGAGGDEITRNRGEQGLVNISARHSAL
jgi:hypothetical protein